MPSWSWRRWVGTETTLHHGVSTEVADGAVSGAMEQSGTSREDTERIPRQLHQSQRCRERPASSIGGCCLQRTAATRDDGKVELYTSHVVKEEIDNVPAPHRQEFETAYELYANVPEIEEQFRMPKMLTSLRSGPTSGRSSMTNCSASSGRFSVARWIGDMCSRLRRTGSTTSLRATARPSSRTPVRCTPWRGSWRCCRASSSRSSRLALRASRWISSIPGLLSEPAASPPLPELARLR